MDLFEDNKRAFGAVFADRNRVPKVLLGGFLLINPFLEAADYLLATFFLMGLNTVTTAFYYSISFGGVFGLCPADLWFGPTYAKSVEKQIRIP